MRKIIHSIKLFFSRIKWYFNTINYARTHAKEVDNYEFLMKAKRVLHQKYLEIERREMDDDKLVKIGGQLELIDKILNYVKR